MYKLYISQLDTSMRPNMMLISVKNETSRGGFFVSGNFKSEILDGSQTLRTSEIHTKSKQQNFTNLKVRLYAMMSTITLLRYMQSCVFCAMSEE